MQLCSVRSTCTMQLVDQMAIPYCEGGVMHGVLCGAPITDRLIMNTHLPTTYHPIQCDDQLVRTSSLRGEGDGVGTIPVVLHLSHCCIMGLGPHLSLNLYSYHFGV